jgi:integrase
MPRISRPFWHEKHRCYRYRFQGHDYYLRGIAHGDMASVRTRVAEIEAAADAKDRSQREPTVERLCAEYLAWSGQANSYRTTIAHEWILRRFCAFEHQGVRYGDRPAAAITATDLGRMDKAWKAAGRAAGYRAQLFKSVLACWNWAARPEPDRVPERLLESNALSGMRRPSVRGKADRYAERSDLAAFLLFSKADVNGPWPLATRGRCMACMAAKRSGPCRRSHAATVQMLRDTLVLLRVIGETGCRPGEACSARWEDWNPEAGRDARTGHRWGVLEVEHKNIRWTGAKRKLVIPPLLVRAIERIRAREGRHPEFIFTHRRGRGASTRGADLASAGEPWNTTSLDARLRGWRKALLAKAEAEKKASPLRPDFTPYMLRHGYYSRTAPVLGAELAGLLGGTSGGVVRQKYLHGQESTLVEAARVARASRGKSAPKGT